MSDSFTCLLASFLIIFFSGYSIFLIELARGNEWLSIGLKTMGLSFLVLVMMFFVVYFQDFAV